MFMYIKQSIRSYKPQLRSLHKPWSGGRQWHGSVTQSQKHKLLKRSGGGTPTVKYITNTLHIKSMHFGVIDYEWTNWWWVCILWIQYYLPDSWTANPRNIKRLRRKAPRIKLCLKAILLYLIPVRNCLYLYTLPATSLNKLNTSVLLNKKIVEFPKPQ